jgi:hypothetical protein
LVGDLRQLASVRRIVLDDGPERGVQALAFSTGGGLDFWVLCDRSFDIGPLWFKGMPVAWQGPNGFASPALRDLEGDGGFGFERLFSGFLVTCGLDHIRQPQNASPLHGRLPFTPGRLLSHGEDWDASEPVLFCEGEMTQARLNGERLRLRRRIEAPIGRASLRILDEVQNIGGREEEASLLYHINFGFPIVGPGTTVRYNDKSLLGPLRRQSSGDPPSVMGLGPDARRNNSCSISRQSDGEWQGLTATVAWDGDTLPYAQVWCDLQPHTHIIAIEPVTSARRDDGTSERGPVLAPRHVMRCRVDVNFSGR